MRHQLSARALQTTLALLGIGATLLALATVVTALRGHAAVPADACRGFVSDHLSLGWLLTATLALAAGVVLVRAVLATRRMVRANRRVVAATRALPVHVLAGGPVRVIASERSVAFCAGFARPAVVVSTATLDRLRLGELRAVLAHERHHAARRDPLRRAARETIAEALFFLPILRPLATRASTLAEIDADAAAIDACGGDVSGLASALLAFEESGQGEAEAERVDQLAGTPTPWQAPRRPLIGALVTLAAALALPVLAVERTLGASLDFEAFGASICLSAFVVAPFALLAVLLARRADGDGTVTA